MFLSVNEEDVCTEIVRQFNIGYAVIDDQLIIQQANATIYQWLTKPTKQLVGKPLTEAFCELVGQETVIQGLFKGDTDTPFVLAKIQRGLELGQEHYFDLRLELSPQLSAQQNNLLLLTVIDVTAYSHLEQRITQQRRELALEIAYRKQIEADIWQAKTEAESANRAKTAFLTNISHELRTPIHAIMGFTALIKQDDNLSLKQQQHLQIISENGENLLTLINQVLTLTKLEIEKGETILPESYQYQSELIQRLFQTDHIETNEAVAKHIPPNDKSTLELQLQLEQLPLKLRTQLKEAIEHSDMDLIESLIIEIHNLNPAMSQHLMTLANQFLYDELLQLL